MQSGSEPDRFGFWAVQAIVKVRHPAVRRGRQLEALVQFAGVDPVGKKPWPMEWVSITLLKSDLKRQARDMERAMELARRPPVAPSAAGSKRWVGLVWDGADEGLPRRSCRRTDDAAPAEVEVIPRPVEGPSNAVVAQFLAQVSPLPSGGAPAGMVMARAWPKSGGETVVTWAVEGSGTSADKAPPADGGAFPTVRPTSMLAGGAPVGVAMAQAWPIGGDVALADDAMDVSGDAGVVVDLVGEHESEETAACSEFACGCGYGYRCASHRLT